MNFKVGDLLKCKSYTGDSIVIGRFVDSYVWEDKNNPIIVVNVIMVNDTPFKPGVINNWCPSNRVTKLEEDGLIYDL